MDFVKDFFRFLMKRKKYWLFPIFIMIVLMGALIFFSKGSAVAPFVYTVF